MDTIIAYRTNGGRAQLVIDEDGEVMVFPFKDEAVIFADQSDLFQSGQADYQIIVLDEL